MKPKTSTGLHITWTWEGCYIGMYLGKFSGWVYSVVKEKGNKFNYKNYQIKVGDAKCLE